MIFLHCHQEETKCVFIKVFLCANTDNPVQFSDNLLGVNYFLMFVKRFISLDKRLRRCLKIFSEN